MEEDNPYASMMDASGRVPVFVFPGEAEFVVGTSAKDDPHPNRKCFTLYNPFDYPISYRILCTAAHNYTVPDNEGTLRERCQKDIVIRCKQRLQVGQIDKLRFETRRLGERELLGCKDIRLRTVLEASSSTTSNEFQSLPNDRSKRKEPTVHIDPKDPSNQPQSPSPQNQLFCILTGIVCACALLVPTIGDTNSGSSLIPSWVHLTLQQKLVAAYILGIVTILVLRPQL
ncbi:unnamed protein product, partial [Mesorhabditis belari]|uniref:Motile sperm domain-containing protein 1 n=1 Tax=Mesorhabditis belari TaxID=2138241 RepID=A0AAF3EH49_9BILA